MNKFLLKEMLPYTLVLSMLLSGCGKKSDCEIPSRHVHKYVKQVTDETTVQRYIEDEHLTVQGYEWTTDYIEVNSVDSELYKVLAKKKLFDGATNWDYLYNKMASNRDYLMFYYEYTTIETYYTTDSDGNMQPYTVVVTHNGWHDNPNAWDNTGRTRLYHYRYYGYQVVFDNGSFKLEKSSDVDDIRDIIADYPYFSEDCVTKVYEEFRFNKKDLALYSPEDFDVFVGPDLSNPNLEAGNTLILEK